MKNLNYLLLFVTFLFNVQVFAQHDTWKDIKNSDTCILSPGGHSDGFSVVSTVPVNHQINSPSDGVITIIFSEDVDFSSISTSSFIVYGEQTGLHTGSFVNDSINYSVIFYSERAFPAGDMVSVILTDDVSSSLGTPLKPHFFKYTIETPSSSNADFVIDESYSSSGSYLRDIVSADLDGDGDIDLAILASYPSTLGIWLNDGSGKFTLESTIDDSAYPLKITARDFDLDGDIDLVTASDGTCNCVVYIYRNNGDATFEKEYVDHFGIAVGGLFGEDINSDGYCELLLTNRYALEPALVVLINSGSGTFHDSNNYEGTNNLVFDVTVNDVDGDGDADITIAQDNTTWMINDGYISCYLNDGTGSFPDVIDNHYDEQIRYLYMNDFNNNGNIDAATVASMGAGDRYFMIAYNDYNGTFTNFHHTIMESFAMDIVGGDLDGDGDIDLTYILYNGNQHILLNDGTGIFSDDQTINHNGGNVLSMADYNMDGRIDLVHAISDQGKFTVMLNADPVDIRTYDQYSHVTIDAFPNPFSSEIEIKVKGIDITTEPLKITIYDMYGRVVYNISNSMSSTVIWSGQNTSGEMLPTGLYYCQVMAGNRVVTEPLLYLGM